MLWLLQNLPDSGNGRAGAKEKEQREKIRRMGSLRKEIKQTKTVEQTVGSPSTWVTVGKVNKFRNAVEVGDVLMGRRAKDTVQILAKYKNGAVTDKGWVTWSDLYLYNIKHLTCTDTGYAFYKR